MRSICLPAAICFAMLCGTTACNTQPPAAAFVPVEFDGLYAFNAPSAEDLYMRIIIDNGYVVSVEDGGTQKSVSGSTPVQQALHRVNFVAFSAIIAPLPNRAPEPWNISFSGDQVAPGSYRGKLTLRLVNSAEDYGKYDA